MKQQNGNEYSISSIKVAFSAIYRYLNQNSVISNCNLYNLYDDKIYKQFWQVHSGKIKYLTDLGYGEKNGLRGGEHFYLMDEDFKKREDGGFDILIYQSKTNQQVEIGNRGKAADNFILPNNPDIIVMKIFVLLPSSG
ncbi:unnamed protein product [Rhizophagus irregularis]|nr:unnamed protein product [Rhizophagus irregularis]